MTPEQFAATYRPVADTVAAATGIDPIALLTQWANETSWGTAWAGAPYNLANIRNGPGGSIISYPSMADFEQDCVWTFHNARPNLNLPVSGSNNYYWPVLAATNAVDQLAAIVASPWSSGHYGGSLMGFYGQLEAYELTPDQSKKLDWLYVTLGQMYYAGKNAAGAPNWPNWDTLMTAVTTPGSGGGGTPEPPESAEPKNITLTIPSVPGTATGTIS